MLDHPCRLVLLFVLAALALRCSMGSGPSFGCAFDAPDGGAGYVDYDCDWDNADCEFVCLEHCSGVSHHEQQCPCGGDVCCEWGDDDDEDAESCGLGSYGGSATVYSQLGVGGLAGYTSIAGDLKIECPGCVSLGPLYCLEWISGDLGIADCGVLEDLDGLDALEGIGGDLIVRGNESLPDCAVCDLLDLLESGPDAVDVHDNRADECTPVPEGCEPADAGPDAAPDAG